MKPIAGGAIQNGTLSIKYILQNDCVSAVIPGMEKPEEVQQNISVASGNYTFTQAEKERGRCHCQ